MARDIPAATQALLEGRTLVVRDFLRITARRRDNGAPVSECFWSDLGDVNFPVIDPETRLAVSYDFKGVGALIAMDPIPMVSNLTVQNLSIQFSQLENRINELLRKYDLRQADVVVWRGEFDPATMRMIEPADVRFVGYVDGAPVDTPAEGEAGEITLECVSTSQELTRSNSDVRSHESQQIRAPGDDFFKDVAQVDKIKIFWGGPRRIKAVGVEE
ncbi:hypothetical protein J4729_07395 [Leisingera sp. HS039]|uniref:hypothetical protein n=1 Tax=Leisingera sp. HS039 TaxID=2818496 RepID=UPI001B3A37C6|nr:hypothetical protein [Leisingera sp. HS039]MBQ4824373.1 hypothetical protein [Leisingera sp. HS039]